MASWRDRLHRGSPSSTSTAPAAPEPASEVHRRALAFVDQMTEDGLSRLLGDMPGQDRLAGYLRGRARRELAKLEEEQVLQFLALLRALVDAVATGENFEEALRLASMRREEPAA